MHSHLLRRCFVIMEGFLSHPSFGFFCSRSVHTYVSFFLFLQQRQPRNTRPFRILELDEMLDDLKKASIERRREELEAH
jgi:hypothetical protein